MALWVSRVDPGAAGSVVPASRQHALAERQVVAFRSLAKLTEGDDFRVIFTDAGPAMVVGSDLYVGQEDWRVGELLAGHGFVEDQPEQAEGADRFGEVAEVHRLGWMRPYSCLSASRLGKRKSSASAPSWATVTSLSMLCFRNARSVSASSSGLSSTSRMV